MMAFPFPLLFCLLHWLLLIDDSDAGAAVGSQCPQGTTFFGPCINNVCPDGCPGTCSCFGPAGSQDCCSSNSGGNGGTSSSLLTRLLLALLLSSGGGVGGGGGFGVPQARLSLVLCRDIALNCAFYSIYCSLPGFALCMRTHCAATCGFCNDFDGGGLLGPLLINSVLGVDGTTILSSNARQLLNGSAASQLAVRAGAPPIRMEQGNSTNSTSNNTNSNATSGATTSSSNSTSSNNNRMPLPRQPLFSAQRRPPSWSPTGGGGAGFGAASPLLQFAVPPGLQIPDRQRLRQRMERAAAIARRLAAG